MKTVLKLTMPASSSGKMPRFQVKPDSVDSDSIGPRHQLPEPVTTTGDANKPPQQPGSRSESSASTPDAAAVEAMDQERQALLDRLARTQAEFDNARKRMDQEQQNFRSFALADTVKSLLPVLDSFELASHCSTQDPDTLRTGMDLIHRQLRDALTKLGLQDVPAKGENFDPHFHEALDVVIASGVEDGHVVDELRRGYKLGERLLRPAMVVVAAKPQNKQ